LIISKTPLRVSMFGGGTDYREYFREHGGEVLGFSVNKFVYITLRKLPPFFDYKHRIVWSKTELVKDYAEIEHPAVREIMRLHGPACGIELHHDGDLPARSGLGSSSAFTVGLLHALYAFTGTMVNKQTLGSKAIQIEQNVLKENVGSQDQLWAAYGGFNRIEFKPNGDFDVSPIILPEFRRLELKRSLMLFFTGFSRIANEIAGRQIANFNHRQRHLRTMREMVPEALAILQSKRDLREIGQLLHEGWRLKKELANGVSTEAIDAIYEAARSAGAVGGKLLGAGGGGFLLLFVPEEYQDAVRKRLQNLINVGFDFPAPGSTIVLYEPNGL
jgi:D-glycero-alpha-D-manno-heptose-7-phosphate kinase